MAWGLGAGGLKHLESCRKDAVPDLKHSLRTSAQGNCTPFPHEIVSLIIIIDAPTCLSSSLGSIIIAAFCIPPDPSSHQQMRWSRKAERMEWRRNREREMKRERDGRRRGTSTATKQGMRPRRNMSARAASDTIQRESTSWQMKKQGARQPTVAKYISLQPPTDSCSVSITRQHKETRRHNELSCRRGEGCGTP